MLCKGGSHLQLGSATLERLPQSSGGRGITPIAVIPPCGNAPCLTERLGVRNRAG